MYHYIYDSFLNEKKYDRVLAKIENSLANFEINGKITKLTKLKSLEDNIFEELNEGLKNIVIVGDDTTLLKIVNIIATYENNDIVLGIIPLGYHMELTKLLGIPEGVDACEILSSRKIETIDLGKVNNKYFVSEIDLGDNASEIDCNNLYKIKALGKNNIKVCNIFPANFQREYSNPKDGYLELFIEEKIPLARKLIKKENIKSSVFPIQKAQVKGNQGAIIDKCQQINFPLDISIMPQKLKIIVGKNRNF